MSDDDENLPAYKRLSAMPEPCSELKSTRRLDTQERAWLEAHGVQIEVQEPYTLLKMPPGTTQQVLYPFVMSSWHRVVLPDGAIMTYVYAPGHMRPYQIGVPEKSENEQ